MSGWSSRLIVRHSRHPVFLFMLSAAFVLLSLTARSAHAQSPHLDVPFVPTPPDVVAKMLEMAQVGPSDFLIDLGSGDGRIAVAAVRDFGAKGAFGVDIDPERVAEARGNAKQAGVADKVQFKVQDLFDTDFSRASVVSMYLLPNVNLQLRPKVLEMAPGTRIVSHAFTMGEWQPDAHADVGGRDVYFWVVPANVNGQWHFTGPEGDFTADLKQNFQNVAGTAKDTDGKDLTLGGRLRGDAITIEVDHGTGSPQRYTGRVQDDVILATLADDGSVQGWQASRRP